jgi:hypothetical protein
VWRSLEARLLWEQDVAGSNPATPTINNLGAVICSTFFCLQCRLTVLDIPEF